MDRLKAALERLDTAVGRLDGALGQRLERLAAEGAAASTLSAAERMELERALADAREGERRARETTSALSIRLDGAIGRLKAVLDD